MEEKEMSSQLEVWYKIMNGKVYRHTENDGYAFMRKGPMARDTLIATVEEAKAQWPGWFKKEFPNESH